MNCVFDIGNTRIKVALFDGAELKNVHIVESREEFLDVVKDLKFDYSIVSSVADDDLTNFVITQANNPLILNYKTPLPVKNLYKTPETLGNDRLANAVGAYHLSAESNSLIIDAGTCLKMDFINSSNQYLGGIISPGLTIRFKAVHTFTDKLPLVKPDDSEEMEMGIDTLTSLHSGCYTGMDREIMATIEDFKRNYDDLKVFITGGDMDDLQKMGFSQKNSIFADRWLTLKGLNEILNYNV